MTRFFQQLTCFAAGSILIIMNLQCSVLKRNSRSSDASDDAVPIKDEGVFGDPTQESIDYETCVPSEDPGSVVAHRLNKVEYINSVRDIFGVEPETAKSFPPDDIGHGFDNIAELLSVAPLLMEKYAAAAEEVASKVAGGTSTAPTPGGGSSSSTIRFEAEGISQTTGGAANNGFWNLWSEGEVYTFTNVATARYKLRARVYQSAAGSEAARAQITVDGAGVHTASVTAGQASPAIIEAEVNLTAGSKRIGVSFLNDYLDGNSDRNLYVDYLELVGPLTTNLQLAGGIASQCSGGEDQCSRDLTASYLRKVYRRSISEEEINEYLSLYQVARDEGDTFEQGMAIVIEAMLMSPQFLFRIEANDGTAIRELDDFELASRLSYFLWSTTPDEELLNLAEEGRLTDPTLLADQVRRMMANPKAGALVKNFAAQWLNLRGLDQVDRDPELFSDFNKQLLGDMRQETEKVIATILNEDRALRELLLADFTYMNQSLAALYGISGAQGAEFSRVNLGGSNRQGLLTQAAFLTATSNPTRTSPVKRGKWIMEQLLCTTPPPPPPNVEGLRDVDPNATLKQQMEAHRANPACASCHKVMDPLGFGFENFDAIGRWRTNDGSNPVDPTGSFPNGEGFTSHQDLLQLLVSKAEFSHCITEKLVTYGLGRGVEKEDRCLVRKLSQDAGAEEASFEDLILKITASDLFRKRRGEP